MTKRKPAPRRTAKGEEFRDEVMLERASHQDRVLNRQGRRLRLGFTGSREGMTLQQFSAIDKLLEDVNVTVAHHGDCIGGDEQFHRLCLAHDVPVEIHPPEDPKLRAFCEGAVRVHRPLPYLDRNKVIVSSSDLVVATPKEDTEPMAARGQGTWSTIRYARKLGTLLRILWPGGEE